MYTDKQISALVATAWTLLHGVTAIPAVSINTTIPSSTELFSSVVVASSRPVVFGLPTASPSRPGVALSSAETIVPSSIHISASGSTPISVSTPSFQFSFAPIIVTHSILPETSPFTLLAPSCPTPVCPACPSAAAASTVTVTVTETSAAAATTAAAIAAIGATTPAAAASTPHTTAPAFSFSGAVGSTSRALLSSIAIPTAPAATVAVSSSVRASGVVASSVAGVGASAVAASGVAASGVAASSVAASGVAASGVAASGVAASGVAASRVGASGLVASSIRIAGATSTSIILLSSVARPSTSVSVRVTPSLPIIPFPTMSPTSLSAIIGTASTTLGTTTTSGIVGISATATISGTASISATTATSATIASISIATSSPAAGLPRRSLFPRGNFTVPLKARLEPMIFRPRGQ